MTIRTFNITVDGEAGQVAVNTTGVPGTSFSGNISSADGGGTISGTVQADGSLGGRACFGSHVVNFTAKLDGNTISGRVTIALFLGYGFTGIEVA